MRHRSLDLIDSDLRRTFGIVSADEDPCGRPWMYGILTSEHRVQFRLAGMRHADRRRTLPATDSTRPPEP